MWSALYTVKDGLGKCLLGVLLMDRKITTRVRRLPAFSGVLSSWFQSISGRHFGRMAMASGFLLTSVLF